MQAFIESLPRESLYMLIGIVGAIVSIPIKDIVTIEFYDICDVFFSVFFVGLILSGMEDGSHQEKWVLITIFIITSIIIMLVKIFIVVPFQVKAETNSLLSKKDYIGEKGKVTVSIKGEGVGEVVLYTLFGNVPVTAKIYSDDADLTGKIIANGEMVQVVKIEESTVYVRIITNEEKTSN